VQYGNMYLTKYFESTYIDASKSVEEEIHCDPYHQGHTPVPITISLELSRVPAQQTQRRLVNYRRSRICVPCVPRHCAARRPPYSALSGQSWCLVLLRLWAGAFGATANGSRNLPRTPRLFGPERLCTLHFLDYCSSSSAACILLTCCRNTQSSPRIASASTYCCRARGLSKQTSTTLSGPQS
jgi:hypothetical protein